MKFYRLNLVEGNLIYYMDNACYKNYTLRKTLEALRGTLFVKLCIFFD